MERRKAQHFASFPIQYRETDRCINKFPRLHDEWKILQKIVTTAKGKEKETFYKNDGRCL